MKISKTTFVISIILLTAFSQSCSFDQVESKYDDYVSAKQDGLFDKGWIPTTITYESMTNIYQKTNIDINTCIFSFNLSLTDIAKLTDKLLLTQIPFEKLPGINTPKWWEKGVKSSNHYLLLENKTKDSIYIAIDKHDNKIFGWFKKKK